MGSLHIILFFYFSPITALPSIVQNFLIFIIGSAGFFWLFSYMQVSVNVFYEKMLKDMESEDFERGYAAGELFSDRGGKNWTSQY